MTLRLFISVLFVASLGSACVHSRFSADGVWIGTTRTTIEAEGQKLMKSSVYRFDLKPDGTCSISVESFWEVDGTKTVDEFEGSWEQRSNLLTVKYNLLDRKNADAKYATTPWDWNEVKHVFHIDASRCIDVENMLNFIPVPGRCCVFGIGIFPVQQIVFHG